MPTLPTVTTRERRHRRVAQRHDAQEDEIPPIIAAAQSDNVIVDDGMLLPGGRVTAPRLIGDRVLRRPVLPNRAAHEALRFFAEAEWTGAPRLLDVNDDGEALTYLAGEVPWADPPPSWASTDEALVAVVELVRKFHDLTAGTRLAGSAEVLCHHDLAPNNTVYQATPDGLLPYAFIDWDIAGPGRRIEDVAHVAWTWLDIGPRVTDPARLASKVRLITDAYDNGFGPAELGPVILWWQRRCWQGMVERARLGDVAMAALVADGTAQRVRAAAEWTETHLDRLRG